MKGQWIPTKKKKKITFITTIHVPAIPVKGAITMCVFYWKATWMYFM